MFRNVGTKERLVDRVVLEIQEQITEGTLPPGTMLPPERELCEQLGVSRTVLREAVRMLVTKGLLETRPGVGTIVRQVTSEQISGPLSILMSQVDEINLDHLHDVRNILEVEIARRAATNATQEDINMLSDLIRSMETARNYRLEFANLDALFHRTLAQTTHNPLLVILMDSISELLQDVRLMVQEYTDLADTVNPGHTQLLKAIINHDPDAAAQAMHDHLDVARSIQNDLLVQTRSTDRRYVSSDEH